MNVALSVDAEGVPFNDTASTALFRIVQEGLTNIARHARGVTTVWIELRCAKGECCLTIRDDGAIDASARETPSDRPRSAGIAGIRERVRRFGGTATIGPLPERGFGVEVCLPMRAVEGDETSR
jgi:signal transduction histidine kinase